MGLAIHFTLQCRSCDALTVIISSTQHRTGTRGPGAFDINTKAALAMLNAGIGPTHMNAVLSVLNLPTIHHKSFKRRGREIGRHIENRAKRSCYNALRKEADVPSNVSSMPAQPPAQVDVHHVCFVCSNDLSSTVDLRTCRKCLRRYHHMCQSEDESGKLCNDCNGSRSPEPITPTPSTSPTLIQASFDGAWAKRGRAYNSLTGVGAAIGANTGKININSSTSRANTRSCQTASLVM